MADRIKWYIKETACWPAAWKVTFDFRGFEVGTSETHNYFRSRSEAQAEANKRNERGSDVT